MAKWWILVALCSLALGIGAFACSGGDDDSDDDGSSDSDSDSDGDSDSDSDSDSDTDADSDGDDSTCPGQSSSCIMCSPDPPTSCDDFAGMGSDGIMGCCSAADGNAWFCDGTNAANDDCTGVGCCFETYQGDPAHTCCGAGSK